MKKLFGLALLIAVVLYFLLIKGFGGKDKYKLEIIDDENKIAQFEVEIADNPKERAEGLMFREELGDNQGMLFIFPQESNHSFWMKNTYISLDIIFADKDKKIVGIIENTEPESTKSLTIGRPSQYILEIEGGGAKKYGIEIGDKLEFKL